MAIQGEVLMGQFTGRGGGTLMTGADAARHGQTVNGHPVSFAAALDGIAAWMDRTEAILVKRGEIKERSNGKVQADLRRAARVLREDPTLDALMVDAMLHGPDRDPDPGLD